MARRKVGTALRCAKQGSLGIMQCANVQLSVMLSCRDATTKILTSFMAESDKPLDVLGASL